VTAFWRGRDKRRWGAEWSWKVAFEKLDSVCLAVQGEFRAVSLSPESKQESRRCKGDWSTNRHRPRNGASEKRPRDRERSVWAKIFQR